MIKRFLRKIKNTLFPKPVIKSYYNSYSQAGEDSILTFLFSSRQIGNPSYIDVGANKPDWSSNTYLFYLRGSKGISIEPDLNLFKKFIQVRPADICLNMAVGYDDRKEVDFFVFDEPSLNTMSEKEALFRDKAGEYKLVNKIRVPVIRLEEVIDKYSKKIPNFISLDVEGIDFEILQSFDFEKYQVPVWVVETIDYSTNHIKVKNMELIKFMEAKGYFVYADTYINTIFVKNDWFYNKK